MLTHTFTFAQKWNFSAKKVSEFQVPLFVYLNFGGSLLGVCCLRARHGITVCPRLVVWVERGLYSREIGRLLTLLRSTWGKTTKVPVLHYVRSATRLYYYYDYLASASNIGQQRHNAAWPQYGYREAWHSAKLRK